MYLDFLSAIVSQNRLNPIMQRAKNDRSVLRALPLYDNAHSSGFTQPEQVILGGAPYTFSKLKNYICHRHADGNKKGII